MRGRCGARTALVTALAAVVCMAGMATAAPPTAAPRTDSWVENERDIVLQQPGPHDGAGTTTAYPFFANAANLGLVFRKRSLHPGATIGAHVNDKDEIYYVLSGRGELTLEGKVIPVGPGDANLTRSGDSHALRQVGSEDLVIFIAYYRPPVAPAAATGPAAPTAASTPVAPTTSATPRR